MAADSLRALGATLAQRFWRGILQTRAAQKASESAVFDVPAPLHIKFASPSVVQPSKFQTTAVEDFKNEISFSKRF